MKRRVCLLAILLALILWPCAALATCGTGNAPSYDDVTAVMLEQFGCDGTFRRKFPDTFECSIFWANFWKGEPSDYSQARLSGRNGYYYLKASVRQIRDILRKGDFFALSPPNIGAVDMAESILSVRRCGVVTKIQIFNDPHFSEPATKKLFDDLVQFVKRAPKTKISSKPREFRETLLYDDR